MRHLPNRGTFFAEVSVAGMELVHKVLDVILVLPALVHIWGEEETCPLVTVALVLAHAKRQQRLCFR